MRKKVLLLVFISGVITNLYAQVNGPERIIGTYTGDLKKGVAHGDGKAVGKDTYEGKFKKGFPEGEGVYTFGEDVILDGVEYSKGDTYEGSFDNGLFEGKGEMTYSNTEKETLEGYWVEGKYSGKTRYGYEVLEKQNIVRVVCQNNGSSQNNITITGLEDIVEVDNVNIEFDGISKYVNLPASKFPFTLYIKGTVPSTGAKARLKIFIERPGIWSIDVETN
jgi:hypothetical protein